MKKMLVLMLMGMTLLVGCEINDNGGDMEMDNTGWHDEWLENPVFIPVVDELPEPDFNVERTVKVIQEAVGSDDEMVYRGINASVFPYLMQAGVKGAISAVVVEDTWIPMLMPDDVIVKIETEDGVHYLLHLARGRFIERVWCYETREQILPPPRS